MPPLLSSVSPRQPTLRRPRTPAGKRAPAVVLGRSVTALGAARCLGRHGVDVLLVAPRGDYAGLSRWARRVDGPAESEDPAPLAAFLRELTADRVLVVPCSDRWASAAAGLPADVRERAPVPVPDAAVLDRLLGKRSLAATLAEAGVPGPRTYEVAGPGDLDALGLGDDELRGWFLKPVDSQAFSTRFGLKAFAVGSRGEAVDALRRAAAADIAVLLQERVPGPPTAHVFVDGYVAQDGRTLARFARRRIRMYPPDFGNSTFHVSVPLDEVPGPVASLDRLLDHVGYRGIFSAEFKVDERDGEAKLLEVNVRPWWYVEFAALCGVDVLALAYDERIDGRAEPVADYATGRRSVFPTADLRALAAAHGRVPIRPLLRSWPGASLTVFEARDPLPAAGQAAELLLRPLRAAVAR
ncbi:MAG: hypothetical protein ACM33B_15450 [Pseudomonadota bacterium]